MLPCRLPAPAPPLIRCAPLSDQARVVRRQAQRTRKDLALQSGESPKTTTSVGALRAAEAWGRMPRGRVRGAAPAALQDRHGPGGAVPLACCTYRHRRRRRGDDVHAGCKVRHWISDPRVGLGRARLKRKAPQEAATGNSMHASDRLIHSICGYLPWSQDDFRFVTGRCRYRPIAWQQLPTAAMRGIAHLALATCSGCTRRKCAPSAGE